jgi:uncharacterized protein YoxC
MSVACSRCKSPNPDQQKHCGECGALLEPKIAAFRDEIEEAVKSQLKEQKVIEIETAQAIVARLSEWAKLFGLVVGVPLAILAVVLAVLGIKTYSDFYKDVEKAKNDTIGHMEENARAKVQEITQEGEQLSARIKAVQDEVDKNQAAIRGLTRRVSGIEEKVEFKSPVNPDLKKRLESTLRQYQEFFKSLGYKPETDHVVVDIRADPVPGAISYYEPSTHTLTIDKTYANDTDMLLREYSHHVLYSGTDIKIPTNVVETWAFIAIESGLANYFACSFKGSPSFGETTAMILKMPANSWSLQNQRRITELKPQAYSILSDGGQIWGGAFWDLRQDLGQEVADKLLYRAWFSLSPSDVKSNDPSVFVRKILDADHTPEAAKHKEQIRMVFANRGLSLQS